MFLTDADREAYLCFLQKYAARRGLAVWAYCLMTNHVHLVVVPKREESLGQALRDAHTVYALYFNTRTELTGHVWQGRFYSTPMDDPHLWAAVRYVEQNPVRAGLVQRAERFRWSSAAAHCGMRADPLLSQDFPPPRAVDDWSAWLAEHETPETIQRLRQSTHTGRPCGSDSFLSHLEHLLQRSLRPRKRGRKSMLKAAETPAKQGEEEQE